MAAAGALSGVGASGVQCDKMSDAWLGARGRTRRGQDSVWAHFELYLSPSSSASSSFSANSDKAPPSLYTLLCFSSFASVTPPPPFFIISLSHRFLYQSPPRVSATVSAEDHTVFRVPPQLMTHSNMEPLNLSRPLSARSRPRPRADAHIRARSPFQLFSASFEDKSAIFFYLFPFSLSLPHSLPVDISPKTHHTFS